MNHQSQILQALSGLGLEHDSWVSKDAFFRILDQLYARTSSRDISFNEDVAEELWDQMSHNAMKEASVKNICSVIAEGQRILMAKIADVQQEIQKYKEWLIRLPLSDSKYAEKENQIKDQIEQFERDYDEYQEDLLLLTTPFGIRINPLDKQHQQDIAGLRQSNLTSQSNSPELRQIFILSTLHLLFGVLIFYAKPDYLNMVVSLALLSIFVFDFFGESYVRMCVWVIVGSLGFDFMWLMVMGGSYWTAGGVEVSSGTFNYSKVVLLLVIVNVLIKIVIGIVLSQFWSVQPGSVFKVSPMSDVRITLTARSHPLFEGTEHSII